MFLGAIIADFGKNKEGLTLYRINGTKEEIESAIERLHSYGIEVWEPYQIEQSHKQLSVLVKLQIPEVAPADETEIEI